jgi:hypothetical protein
MISSVITAKPVWGANPIGFVPLTPQGVLGYFQTLNLRQMFAYNFFTFDPAGQIVTSRANFLIEVKDWFDTVYLPSILTDPAVNYDVEIVLNGIKLQLQNTNLANPQRNDFIEQELVWYVDASIKVNVI